MTWYVELLAVLAALLATGAVFYLIGFSAGAKKASVRYKKLLQKRDAIINDTLEGGV